MPTDGHQFTIEIRQSPISMDHVSVTMLDEATGEQRKSQQPRQWCIEFRELEMEHALNDGYDDNRFYLFLLKTWNGGKEALH